jgi:hypothetical protein
MNLEKQKAKLESWTIRGGGWKGSPFGLFVHCPQAAVHQGGQTFGGHDKHINQPGHDSNGSRVKHWMTLTLTLDDGYTSKGFVIRRLTFKNVSGPDSLP